MKKKYYYGADIVNVPFLHELNPVPGMILTGVQNMFTVCAFPNYDLFTFNSDTDIATVVSVFTDKQSYMNLKIDYYDVILLHSTQKRLFISSTKSRLFSKLDSR